MTELVRQKDAIAREVAALLAPPPARPIIDLAADLGLVLDDWQRDVLTCDAKQMLMLCSRQSGKSTVAAILGLHTALYVPGSLVLIVSPGERQSGRLFRTLLTMYRQLGHPVAADIENRLSLELANGSEVHALPGNEARVRGFSGVDLILEDESSLVADDLHQSLRPMLAVSGGRKALMTTPRGKRGHFYQEWAEGGPTWHRTKITALDCPRIPSDWLENERGTIGDFWFRQEYLCEFLDDEDQLFSTEHIMGSLVSGEGPLALPMFAGGNAS